MAANHRLPQDPARPREGARPPLVPSDSASFDAPALLSDETILFPGVDATIWIRDERNVVAAWQAVRERDLAVLIPASDLEGAEGCVGTLTLLSQVVPEVRGGSRAHSKGLWRVHVQGVTQESPYVRVRFTGVEGGEAAAVAAAPSSRSSQMVDAVAGQVSEFLRLVGAPTEASAFLEEAGTPGKLADMCAYSPFITFEERLDLFETLEPEERLVKVHALFERELRRLKLLPRGSPPIEECATCTELADDALDEDLEKRVAAVAGFLVHVANEHPGELLGMLMEAYGPAFLRKRGLK